MLAGGQEEKPSQVQLPVDSGMAVVAKRVEYFLARMLCHVYLHLCLNMFPSVNWN